METHLPSAHSLRATALPSAVDLEAAGRLHDLANTIQVVASSVRMLKRHPDLTAACALQPLIVDVLTRTERAGQIVRELLHCGVASSTTGVTDVANVVAAVSRDLAALVGEGVRLTARCDAELPPVACSATSLEDALINLVLNARDALPGGGVVLLRAKARRRAGAVTGVELSVHDTGAGMAASVRERALEPYFSTKKNSGGTGLGLPMVLQFARELGGTLAIDSAPGFGTRVTLALPAAPGNGLTWVSEQ